MRKAFPTLEKDVYTRLIQIVRQNFMETHHLWTGNNSKNKKTPTVIIEHVQPVKTGHFPWKNPWNKNTSLMIHGPLVKHLSGRNKTAASSSRSNNNIIATSPTPKTEKIPKQSEQSNLDIMQCHGVTFFFFTLTFCWHFLRGHLDTPSDFFDFLFCAENDFFLG